MEINLIPYKAKHFPQVLEILQSRQSSYADVLTPKSLPKVGYIACVGKQPIAAGFLRRLEPNLAIFDTLCSNAYFGSEARHKAIDLVVSNLIEDANRMKLKGILAFTVDKGVKARAADLGFNFLPDALMVLPLNQK